MASTTSARSKQNHAVRTVAIGANQRSFFILRLNKTRSRRLKKMCDDWEFSSRHTGKRPNGCQGRLLSSRKGKDKSEHRISNLSENLRIISRCINPSVAIIAKFFPRCPNTPVFVRSKAADNLAPSDLEWPLAECR